MGVVTSTLHHSLKFVTNNQVGTVKADPEGIHLYELAVTSHALTISTLKNCIPSLTVDAMECSSLICSMEVVPKASIGNEEPPKAKDLESSTSNPQTNVFLGDDWGSLKFYEFFIIEYKVDPSCVDFPSSLNAKMKNNPAEEKGCNPI